MNRRHFLEMSMATLVLPMTLVACGEPDADDDNTGDSGDNTDSGTDTNDGGSCNTAGDGTGDSNSHGHVITVSAADLATGTGGTYTSTGDHTHDVTLTAQDMTDLLANCTVTVSSTAGGHEHTWVITLPAT
ncbi:MAG: hypothetical protein KC912_13765 [Proteobacteria bacterium]|nr:hypothetical protein [Pseudomonadota bacterium]